MNLTVEQTRCLTFVEGLVLVELKVRQQFANLVVVKSVHHPIGVNLKILIPFTGGVNSTYSLWRWLTETDAEVVTRYAVDKWYNNEYNDSELDRIREIVIYLKSTIRDFEFELTEWPSNYVQELHPIRPGFKLGTWDVGKVRPRYEGYVKWQNETKTDGISIGLSLENTSMDCGYNILRSVVEQDGMDIYLGGMPDLTPVAKGDDFDWEEVSRNMIGRFEQYEFLPKELRDLCIRYSESRDGVRLHTGKHMKNLLMKVRQEKTLICIAPNMEVMVLGDMKQTQKLICTVALC